jgi:hypothetical protein
VNISNRTVGGHLLSLQPHHLLRRPVLHSGAIESDRITVQTIGDVSLLAQCWKRADQLFAPVL